MSDSQRTQGLQPTRLLHPWDFPGKSTGVSCHCLLWLFAEYRGILNSNSCMKVKEEVENVLLFQTPISQEVSKTKLCRVTNLCHTLHRIWFEEIIYLNHNHCCLVTQLCPTLCDPMVLGYLSISMDYSPPGSSVHGIFSGKNTGVGCHFLLQGSSRPRDQTYVSCIGRWILYLGSPVIIIATFSREHRWSCQRFCLVKAKVRGADWLIILSLHLVTCSLHKILLHIFHSIFPKIK